MSLHGTALAELTGWRAPDEEQERLRTAYVEHLRAHDDGMLRSCFPAHLTAGVLVVRDDGREVLLNLHGKARRWFAFGGHVEPGDRSLRDTATREGVEESGLADLVLDPEPIQLSRHRVEFCDPRGPVDHLDVRFRAVVDAASAPLVSAESVELRWWPVDDLPTDEPDMLALVAAARRGLG